MKSLNTADAIRHAKIDGCEELTDEQLRRLQERLYSMVGDILEAAREAGADIMLGGGSALGAYRHQGIIPWDDDVDLMITRSRFDQFIDTFTRRYQDRYWIRVPGRTPGHNLLFTQIRLKGTSVRTRDDVNNDECGLPVDIFVIENTYDNIIRRTLHRIRSMYWGFAVSSRKFKRDWDKLRPLIDGSGSTGLRIMSRIKCFYGTLLSGRDLDYYVRKGDECHRSCSDDNSRYVTVPTGRLHFRREMYERADYLRERRIRYGPYEMRCPGNLEEYLGRLYGDPDKIPDPKEREHHIYLKPFGI